LLQHKGKTLGRNACYLNAMLLRCWGCADPISNKLLLLKTPYRKDFKAFKHIGQLKKAALFESWLRRIMVNESLSLLRKNSGVTLEYELEGQLEFIVLADAPNHFAAGLRMNFD
jgi:hypothetical protein